MPESLAMDEVRGEAFWGNVDLLQANIRSAIVKE